MIAAVHVDARLTLPVGMLFTAVLIWYWIRLGRPGIPKARRRVRRISGLFMLVLLPVLVWGLSFADPEVNQTGYVVAWSLTVFMLLLVFLSACVDTVVTMRLHRQDVENDLARATADLVKAMKEPKGTASAAGSESPDGSEAARRAAGRDRKRMSGPLPALLAPLAAPVSWVYGAAVALRNRRYDRAGSAGAVAVPVISVGNLTAGGSGKSPTVRWLARRLRDAGCRPAIAMRGYGRRAGERSDEEAEYAERLPDVDVVADPDRLAALRAWLPAHAEIDCVILDDGFQHRRLARDLDVVLVDASRRTLDDRMLPWGYLREPAANLRRADAVVVTRAEAIDEALAGRIELAHGRAPIAWSRHRWEGLTVHRGNAAADRVEVGWLRGRRVGAVLGIGHPVAALEQVRAAGAEIAVTVPVRDHQRYGPGLLARIRREAEGLDALVTTGKDWVKIGPLIDLAGWPVPIVVPDLQLDVFAGAEDLTDLALRTVGARAH